MKKILSVVLVLCVLVIALPSYGIVSAQSTDTDEYVYGMIGYTSSQDIKAHKFYFWAKHSGYLDDVDEYTIDFQNELVSEYNAYIEEKRQTLLSEGEAFFEEYFDSTNDELLMNSDTAPYILVRSDAETLDAIRNEEDCWLLFTDTSESDALRLYKDTYCDPILPDSKQTLEPYELVFMEYYYGDSTEDEYIGGGWGDLPDYYFNCKYEHFVTTSDEATVDEATPDYVLVFAIEPMVSPAYSAGVFGDRYLLQEYNIYYPYYLGYHIITTEDMKVYTLHEAWDMDIEGIEDVFEVYGLGQIRGDSDHNRKIDIRDATFLQKCLAGLENFSDDEYVGGFTDTDSISERVSDMNMDSEVNVKDVTAIQKFIAGL